VVITGGRFALFEFFLSGCVMLLSALTDDYDDDLL